MKMTKNILLYSIFAGLFFIPFIPFIVPGNFFFPFITGKGFTFRILVEIIFGLYVLLAFADPAYRPKNSWISKSVLFFAVAIFVADMLGVNPYKSFWSNFERMEGFILVLHLVLYYFVASSVFKTVSKWNQLFNTSIVASALMSLYGVFQLLGLAVINQGGVRVDATFGNSAYLAIYLVLHIFLCLYMFVGHTRKTWEKWAYGLIALLEVVILYFTATRGAILGLIGGLVITGLLVAWKERENKVLRKFAFGVLGALFLIIMGFIAFRNTAVVKNSPVLSRFSTLGVAEFKTQGRYFVWPMAVKGIAERPIFGWGQENFNFVFNKYYNPMMFGQEEWFDRTHNVFFDWLIAGGIVGFLAYASMYVAMFYYVWRKESSLKFSEKSIFTGMIIAYVFHNIFVFDNLISYIVFFSLLAYIHAITVSKNIAEASVKNFSPDVVHYIVTPTVLIATFLFVYFVNIPALRANTMLIQSLSPQSSGPQANLELIKKVFALNSFADSEAVEQLVQITTKVYSLDVPATLKQEFFDFAKLKIEEKIKQTPHDARYLVFAGSFFNQFGRYDTAKYDEAIGYLERAVAESPSKQSIYFELGSSYLGKKNYTKMFELFKKAHDLKPEAREGQVIYALAAVYTKNNSVLKQMIDMFGQDIFIMDNRFSQSYEAIGDYTTAISLLTLRLQKNPKDSQAKLFLASDYVQIGQKQKAIDLIREVIAAEPGFKDQGEAYIKQLQ